MELLEAWRSSIAEFDDLPMFGGPIRIADDGLLNGLAKVALAPHGNGEPANSVRGLDLVAISPVGTRVLHIIEKNEFIHVSDQIKIAFPGDVVGLENGNSFRHVQNPASVHQAQF